MCNIPDVLTNLAADAIFQECLLDMACIFPLDLGNTHLSPMEPPGKGVYQNQSMQGQKGVILDIVLGHCPDWISLLEVLSHHLLSKIVEILTNFKECTVAWGGTLKGPHRHP